jgi:hypothetical protein
MGFYTMIMDHLSVPFETTILGVPVVVESLEISAAEQLVAICRRGVKRQKIGILELPLAKRAPEGAEWIGALEAAAAGLHSVPLPEALRQGSPGRCALH